MQGLIDFTTVIFVIYFLVKAYLSVTYLKKETKTTAILSIFGICASLILNHIYASEYTKMLSMSFVKGAIELPPLWALILLTDLGTSIIVQIYFLKFSKTALNDKFLLLIIDFVRTCVSYSVFMFVLSTFWQNSYEQKLMNTNYICFKTQLEADFENYYARNRKVPQHLQDFTKTLTNPINNSKLIYKSSDQAFQVEISDEKGNILVKGYENFIGLDSRVENPDFKSSSRLILDAYNCPTP